MSSKRNKRSSKPREQTGMPPQINMHPISLRKFRFLSNGSVTTSVIYRRSLLSLQACVTVASTTALTMIQAIRVRRVSMFAVSPSGMAQLAIEWLDPHGPSTQYSAAATPSIPAKLSSVPPKGSFADLWSNVQYPPSIAPAYSEPLFQLQCLADTIIDVECEVVYADGNSTSPPEYISRTTSTNAVGFYYGALDNSSSTNTAGTQVLVTVADAAIVYTN